MNTKLLAALKSLPLIRFALMLGGGIAASLAAGHVQIWLAGWAGAKFPATEAVWLARIQSLTFMGLASIAVVMLVMITLAWGKASGVKGSFNGAEVDVSFNADEGQG